MINNICKSERLCTGCTACQVVCPKNCIIMVEDKGGFRYPQINVDSCISCGLCQKTCPVNNPPEANGVIKSYAVRNKNKLILKKSTSGGAFSAFAMYAFERNGLVFGVGFDDKLKVRHFGIDSSEKNRVDEMICSKYVQSDPGNTFAEVQNALERNRLVIYSGTPCQIAGLKSFLKKDYNKLITIDLVCHGVGSPFMLQQYLEYMSEKYDSKIIDVRFRNKTYGYHSSTMKLTFSNGKEYYGSARVDYMLKAYFSGICSRISCYECPYKQIERCSDFTIFDSWHINQVSNVTEDDDEGYTNIYVHSQKGIELIFKLSDFWDMVETDIEITRTLDGNLIDNFPRKHPKRDEFIAMLHDQSIDLAVKKYLNITPKDYFVERTKSVLYHTGLLNIVKSLKKSD